MDVGVGVAIILTVVTAVTEVRVDPVCDFTSLPPVFKAELVTGGGVGVVEATVTGAGVVGVMSAGFD